MPHFLHQIDDNAEITLPKAHEAVMLLIRQVTQRSRDERTRPGIIGQDRLIRRLITAFLMGEHCLIEGLPGLVKTEVSKTLAVMLGLVFKRIQFTPDIMPSDLIGRETLEFRDGKASIRPVLGPVFTNILLADEINRASPKVQSALLEACEERQVTALHRETVRIRPSDKNFNEQTALEQVTSYFGRHLEPDEVQHFMVLATMNPIELEGVFPLSEAQIDRFALKLMVDYPAASDLRKISEHAFEHDRLTFDDHSAEEHVRTLYFLSILRGMLLGPVALERWRNNRDLCARCQNLVDFTHLGRAFQHEDSDLTEVSTRAGAKHEELLAKLGEWQNGGRSEDVERANRLQQWRTGGSYPDVRGGSSPRGLLKLVRAAHVEAFLRGDFDDKGPLLRWDHVVEVAPDVLRHRVRLSSAPSAMAASAGEFIHGLLEKLVP